MNQFLKHIFVFIAGFLVINLSYFLLIYYSDWNFRKRHESLRFKNPKFDVLILGNSLALDGFDTEYMTMKGISAYNLAIAGSSMRTNFIQLTEYIENYKTSPKIVILGHGSFAGSKVESDFIHPIVEITMKEHIFSYKDLPILKFRWLGLDAVKKIISKNHREAVLSYGQLKFKKIVKDKTTLKNNLKFDLNTYKKLTWLARISELCKRNKIKLVIIEMPGFKKTRNVSSIGPYFLDSNQNEVPLYNYNQADYCKFFDDEKDWIGNSHLNENGARKLTESFLPIINLFLK